MKVWADYDQEALDKAYNARATVPDFDVEVARYAAHSARVRDRLGGRLGLSYGPTADEVLDVFPAAGANGGAPVNVFIHGGYWRALTKDEHSFAAGALAPAGAAVVVNSYALAPAVTLDEIVRQCRATVAWAYRNAADFGGNPERLYVSGHSAGGHLAAMMALGGWHGDYDIPDDAVKGVTLVSGLFDLRPIRRTYVNEWLGLDGDEQAERNSPLFHIPKRSCPLVITYAELDPEGFRTQSRDFLAAWRDDGHPARYVEMPGFNHFTVVEELANPDSPLFRAVAEQMGL